MDYKKIAKNLVFLFAICVLVYFDISRWGSGGFGLLLLLVYLFYIARGARTILAKFFNLSHKAFRIKILGMFLGVITLSWLLEPIIIFSRLTSAGIAAIFFINGALYFFLEQWSQIAKKNEPEEPKPELEVLEEVPQAKVWVFIYLLMVLYGFFLLFKSRTGASITTPWQTIDPGYIYIFFFSTLILGFLIFSKLKAKAVLFLLVVHSFLMLSYLPLTHELIYGADQWRHMATEARIVQQKSVDLTLYDQSSFLSKLDPGKFSYSQLWGVSAVASRLLSVSLLSVNAWLIPIVWSLVFPILLFEIAGALGFAKKQALFFAWLGFLPFAFQAGGSFTLPVNWGFLVWLLFTMLVLKRLQESRKGQILILAIAGAGLLFGYALYAVLFVLAWGTAEVLLRCKNNELKPAIIIIPIAILFIPVIEFVTGYGNFGKINIFSQIKQFAGNFTGYYLASGPRPHDITTGNIIFNQTPSYAFVGNFFTQWRWWIFVFALLFIAGVIYGLIIAWRKNEIISKWAVVMLAGLLGGYFISLYLLAGEHVLARRLDGVIALFFLIMFFYAWINLVFNKFSQLTAIILSVFIFSLAITASYSLGPDTASVSADQYEAANFIWQNELASAKHCVLADTYPLLALEAVSSKEIVGGGFPINQYFAQPERVELLAQMKNNINGQLLDRALGLTKSDHCWFVGNMSDFKKQGLLNGGGNYNLFGDIVVLRYNNNNLIN